ncbi:HlyD family secretion protein [Rubritalea sp.]|uniref:HlyD family secretion protein n=1 Tax=Rubritalea sp. TaxID=2109375 RepID=UPI003EF393F0
MELIITAIYIWIIWLIWYKFKWLKPNIVWKVSWPSLLVAAISLELICLGQFCPYSEKSFITTYVYQMAPEYGGMVKEVYAKPNTPIKKGEKLYQMDPTQWQAELDGAEASLAAAKQVVKENKAALDAAEAALLGVKQQEKVLDANLVEDAADIQRLTAELKTAQLELSQYQDAAKNGGISKLTVERSKEKVDSQTAELQSAEAKKTLTMAQLTQLKVGSIPQAEATREKADLAYNSKINGEFTEVAQAQAQVDKYQYIVDDTTIVAPTDGYVVDMDLQPGVEIRLKQGVMTFVNSEPGEYWVIGRVPQFGMQRVQKGDTGEVMLKLYPSMIFEAEVLDVIWATGEAQITPTANLPDLASLGGGEFGGSFYAVKMGLKNLPEGFTPHFGASGRSAIYPESAPAFLVLLRKLEIRMDSWVSYLYR